MNISVENYKNVSLNKDTLKLEAEEYRDLFLPSYHLQKLEEEEKRKNKLGFYLGGFLFWGSILFGIVHFFYYYKNTETKTAKKTTAKKLPNYQFNLIKIL